jgi:crossover junction endodeoxyribonuclease RuvC
MLARTDPARAELRVLGVDPGTYRMGVGVVTSDGAAMSLVYSGVLTPKRRDPISDRLHHLFSHLLLLIDEWRPSELAVEEPFAGRNVRAAMAIGHAQAVAMVAAAQCGLPISGYAPRRVKQAVTDYGGSSKEQVQEMVMVLLRLDAVPDSSDAADALAVAICHINATEGSKALVVKRQT